VADAARLTDALRRNGALGDGRVVDVAVEKSWPTLLSRIMRLRLTYEGDAAVAPRSLIFKTSLPERMDPSWTSGPKEVAFYTKIAPATPAGLVPRCYDGDWNPQTNGWHLLLEDLTDSHIIPTAWPIPPAAPDCERIIAARARFHAAWWDEPRLGVSLGTWLPADDGQITQFAAEFARFADRLGDRLSPERRSVYERLIAEAPRLNRRHHSHRNLTIVHGDAHMWNVFLPRDEKSEDVRIFDWDCWAVDVATDDLAYMMALHWFPDHRRRFERAMLDRYHAELLAHGVTGYDREALGNDYRLSALWQIATPVWQAALNIPPVIWWNHLERIFMAVDDLDCRDLL
jgi:hypothetical protein